MFPKNLQRTEKSSNFAKGRSVTFFDYWKSQKAHNCTLFAH